MRLVHITLLCAVLLASAEALKCWSSITEDGGQVEVDCDTKAHWSDPYDQCFSIKRRGQNQTMKGCFDGSYHGGSCTVENVNDLALLQSDSLHWVAMLDTQPVDWEAPTCCSGEKCNDN